MSCVIVQWVGTPDGSEIPPVGSLYIHDESLRGSTDDQPSMEVSALGTGKLAITRVDDAVARIDYEARPGTNIEIHSTIYDETWTYKVAETWRTPAPRVVEYWHMANQWPESPGHTFGIELDEPTAAIHVRWTSHGQAIDRIEPPETLGSFTMLGLGSIPCNGTPISSDQLTEGGELELYAISFDGLETPIFGMPRHIKLRDASAPPDPYRPTRMIGAIVIAFVALGIGLGLRMRVRAPIDV